MASELDLAVLRKLESAIGPEGIVELVGLMEIELAARLADFRCGVEQRDLPLARRAAHTLKSACSNLGARRYAQFCADTESAALRDDAEAVAAARPELERRAAQVLKELLAERERLKP